MGRRSRRPKTSLCQLASFEPVGFGLLLAGALWTGYFIYQNIFFTLSNVNAIVVLSTNLTADVVDFPNFQKVRNLIEEKRIFRPCPPISAISSLTCPPPLMPSPALKSNYWFILGREPLLSAAELAAVLVGIVSPPWTANPTQPPLGKGRGWPFPLTKGRRKGVAILCDQTCRS